jgi:hypothetical protein
MGSIFFPKEKMKVFLFFQIEIGLIDLRFFKGKILGSSFI